MFKKEKLKKIEIFKKFKVFETNLNIEFVRDLILVVSGKFELCLGNIFQDDFYSFVKLYAKDLRGVNNIRRRYGLL